MSFSELYCGAWCVGSMILVEVRRKKIQETRGKRNQQSEENQNHQFSNRRTSLHVTDPPSHPHTHVPTCVGSIINWEWDRDVEAEDAEDEEDAGTACAVADAEDEEEEPRYGVEAGATAKEALMGGSRSRKQPSIDSLSHDAVDTAAMGIDTAGRGFFMAESCAAGNNDATGTARGDESSACMVSTRGDDIHESL